MLGVQDDHFGRTPCLAAGLDDTGEGIIALHEGDRAGRLSPTGQQLFGGTNRGEIGAGAAPPFKEHAFRLGQVQNGFHPVFYRVDEASRALGFGLNAAIEPDRAVECCLLIDQEVGELRLEGVGVFRRGKVSPLLPPLVNRVHHSSNELSDASLSPLAIGGSPEVLGDHHVCRQHGPTDGYFHVRFLEDHLSLFIGDACLALLPLNLIEGMHPGAGVNPVEVQESGFFRHTGGYGRSLALRLGSQ